MDFNREKQRRRATNTYIEYTHVIFQTLTLTQSQKHVEKFIVAEQIQKRIHYDQSIEQTLCNKLSRT